MRNLFLVFIIFFISFVQANENERCSFMGEIDEILKTDPILSAKNYKYTGPQMFLGVGNGRVPSRPGFENGEEEDCVWRKHKFNHIKAGWDVIRCKGQREKGKLLEIYAAEYNKQIKKSLTSMGLYQCAT
jgi:hypothetical protein